MAEAIRWGHSGLIAGGGKQNERDPNRPVIIIGEEHIDAGLEYLILTQIFV